ncbi:MAG: STAS/SEC14 domain-containing protein [Candidatus Obscuribacterales bacterium]|nr:STAS/SEC14 domain-containing protein [Candidatus Obscuribacterales bacterium]
MTVTQLKTADHVIAINMTGKVTEKDMATYKSLLDEKLKKHDRVSFFVDISGLSDITEDGIKEGAKSDLAVLTHSHQVGRCAIVSDKEWPLAAIHLYQKVVPTLELKVFNSGMSLS